MGGFRFSGDFRYRLDLQLRSANSIAGPLQNTRGRYRVRLNVDKEIASGLTAHAQISTGPYSNYTTNDEDWAGVAAKVPFSLAEAWIKYTRKDFSIRAGRMEEVFADSNRFLWDDDIRFNGVDTRYNLGLNQNNSLEFRAAEYVLTNPNTPVVAAGSPYLAIGYQVGQKVRDASMFHPGFIFKTKSGAWTNQFYSDLTWIHHADQIQLASTAAGFPVLVNNALGITLSGPVGQTGNATTTPGGPLYAARHWQILKAGYRLDYAAMKWGSRPMPFWADFQGLFNAGTGSDRSAMMATLNFGQIRKFGDVRFLYQISRKEANSMISQFTDDDLGTQTGVNTRVNSIRFDVGFTRFLQWQNILFIQQPLTGSRPGFYVTLPAGANTTYRYLGQLAFAF